MCFMLKVRFFLNRSQALHLQRRAANRPSCRLLLPAQTGHLLYPEMLLADSPKQALTPKRSVLNLMSRYTLFPSGQRPIGPDCVATKIGSRASISFHPGNVFLGIAHSLLLKMNGDLCVMKRTSKIRRAKMLAQGGRCYYCDQLMWEHKMELGERPDRWPIRKPRALQCTAEHLHPRSDGGADTPENIVAACWFCNSTRHKKKQARSPQQHREHARKRMRQGRWLQVRSNLL